MDSISQTTGGGDTASTSGLPATADYDLGAIRDLIRAAFTAQDLKRFCYDRPAFKPIVSYFGANPVLEDMIDAVLEYCEKRALFPRLLSAIHIYNPEQYARFEDRLPSTVATPTPLPPHAVQQPLGVYVVNDSLAVRHFMIVSADILAWQLVAQVCSVLSLPDSVSAAGGRFGLRFRYVLFYDGRPLPEGEPVAQAGIGDGATLELRIAVEQFALDTTMAAVVYRDDAAREMPRSLVLSLVDEAFGHLAIDRHSDERDNP